MIRADVVDTHMQDVLQLLVLPGDWHDEILTIAESIVYCEQGSKTTERMNEQTLRAKLQRVLDQYEDGYISRDEYRTKAASIQQQIQQLDARDVPEITASTIRKYAYLLNDVHALIEEGDIYAKRALIKQLFSHVYLHREPGRGRNKHSVRALTPTEAALPLIAAIYHKVQSVSRVGIEPTTL
jgi:hypothetical protein